MIAWHPQHTAQNKKSTMYQVTTMLATSKNVLFPGHNHHATHRYWSSNTLPSMVVTRWIVAFIHSAIVSTSISFRHLVILELKFALNTKQISIIKKPSTQELFTCIERNNDHNIMSTFICICNECNHGKDHLKIMLAFLLFHLGTLNWCLKYASRVCPEYQTCKFLENTHTQKR